MVDSENSSKRADIVLDLFDRYYDRVYAFARKSAEASVAEDATQEAFVRLLQHPRLEELEISISYLLKIVTTSSVVVTPVPFGAEILDDEVIPHSGSSRW